MSSVSETSTSPMPPSGETLLSVITPPLFLLTVIVPFACIHGMELIAWIVAAFFPASIIEGYYRYLWAFSPDYMPQSLSATKPMFYKGLLGLRRTLPSLTVGILLGGIIMAASTDARGQAGAWYLTLWFTFLCCRTLITYFKVSG